jgi:hypothetical protein
MLASNGSSLFGLRLERNRPQAERALCQLDHLINSTRRPSAKRCLYFEIWTFEFGEVALVVAE